VQRCKAIHTAYIGNVDKVCVVEDDVHTELIKTCEFDLESICNLRDDWEIIQLYFCLNSRELFTIYVDYINNGLRLIDRNPNSYSGTCYIINRRGMSKILSDTVDTDGAHKFIFKNKVISPEDAVFLPIKSFAINRQIFYYYFPAMTYDNYSVDKKNMIKKASQHIQLDCANFLTLIYSDDIDQIEKIVNKYIK